MITTNFVPGSPCWVDLGAPDVAAAAAFYGAVFGWQPERVEGAPNDFTLLRSDGDRIGAIGRLDEAGAHSAWMVYFYTDDIDATAKAVERGGGSIRVAPTDIRDAGRMAQFTDPQGAQFAARQPGVFRGLEAADRPGTLNWVELYTTDSAAAKSFYGDVFGWTTGDMPMPGGGGTYSIITPAGQPTERMHGGLMQLPAEMLGRTGGRAYWHPVFAVADCDATVATVTANGGTVQMGPQDAEGVGRLAVCTDPNAAEFVVLTPVG